MSEKTSQIEQPTTGAKAPESTESTVTSIIQDEIQDHIQSSAIESIEQTALIREINEAMASERNIWEGEITDKLRQINNPVIVDFNNVLATNQQPLKPNPAAASFIEKVSTVGTVIVLTTAKHAGRSDIQQIISQLTVNPEKVILITSENYFTDSPNDELIASRNQTIQNFFNTPIGQESLSATHTYGSKTKEEILADEIATMPPAYKRVGPIFSNGKTAVPIIDDTWDAVENNPGLKGFYVEKWPRPEYPSDMPQEQIDFEETERKDPENPYREFSLEEAAEEVIKLYSK